MPRINGSISSLMAAHAAGLPLYDILAFDTALSNVVGNELTRGQCAMVLTTCLFDKLLSDVPSGAAYVSDILSRGDKITFDHGAVRTISFGHRLTGSLPAGKGAIDRILIPLGYAVAGQYPLPELRMTGYAYAHLDHPENLPQFFVSELHVDRFNEKFGLAAERIFASSRDPLGEAAALLFAALQEKGSATISVVASALPQLLAAFARQHDVPHIRDYNILRDFSAEAAWIATEGNAFNHATDRVTDVEAVAAEQRLLGRPIKDRVEVSQSGRVRQTAFHADLVNRIFQSDTGPVECKVPGSFYEFISRDVTPDSGRLDLSFDSANATKIFAMTKAP